MPTKVWAEGEEVLAADFNPMVQEQVIPTFANASARDTAMPTPHLGQHCFLNDVRQLQQFTDRTTPPSWRRPWSEAWGLLSYYVVVPDTRFSTAPGYIINGGFMGLTVPNRMARARLSGWVSKEADGVDAHLVFRLLAGPPPHTVLRDSVVTLHQGWAAMLESEAIFPTESYNQVHWQCWTSAGVGNTAWLRVEIEDMGPSPATPLT